MGFELITLVVIATDCMDSCDFNYLTFTTTVIPRIIYSESTKIHCCSTQLSQIQNSNLKLYCHRSVLLVEKTGVPEESYRHFANHSQALVGRTTPPPFFQLSVYKFIFNKISLFLYYFISFSLLLTSNCMCIISI